MGKATGFVGRRFEKPKPDIGWTLKCLPGKLTVTSPRGEVYPLLSAHDVVLTALNLREAIVAEEARLRDQARDCDGVTGGTMRYCADNLARLLRVYDLTPGSLAPEGVR